MKLIIVFPGILDAVSSLLRKLVLASLKIMQTSLALNTRTNETLLQVAHLAETIESRKGHKIACREEIVFNPDWLSAEQLKQTARQLNKNSYGDYLLSLLPELA